MPPAREGPPDSEDDEVAWYRDLKTVFTGGAAHDDSDDDDDEEVDTDYLESRRATTAPRRHHKIHGLHRTLCTRRGWKAARLVESGLRPD